MYWTQIVCWHVLLQETILNSNNVVFVHPYFRFGLITADPDDNKFTDCAITAGADFIVTNDRHFNVLKEIDFPKVNVIDMDTFKSIISG